MTEAAKIAISRTEIITIKTKKEAAKGRMTTVPTGRKGLKEGVAREEVLTGRLCLWQGPESMIPGDGWEYDIAPDQMPNLDISGNEGLPDMSFGMGGNTFVLKEGKIPTYLLLKFWVFQLPFVRVMAMDNYRRSHWSMINEAPELMFLFGRKWTENFPKYCQDKACGAFKGYIPVLSGNFEMKYEFSLLEYKQSGVFYSTGVIENFTK